MGSSSFQKWTPLYQRFHSSQWIYPMEFWCKQDSCYLIGSHENIQGSQVWRFGGNAKHDTCERSSIRKVKVKVHSFRCDIYTIFNDHYLYSRSWQSSSCHWDSNHLAISNILWKYYAFPQFHLTRVRTHPQITRSTSTPAWGTDAQDLVIDLLKMSLSLFSLCTGDTFFCYKIFDLATEGDILLRACQATYMDSFRNISPRSILNTKAHSQLDQMITCSFT